MRHVRRGLVEVIAHGAGEGMVLARIDMDLDIRPVGEAGLDLREGLGVGLLEVSQGLVAEDHDLLDLLLLDQRAELAVTQTPG